MTCAHYLYDPDFCNVASGWEKGARGEERAGQIEGVRARNLAEIADREKIDRSYVTRMVNLTTLAPDIQAAILDETLPEKWCSSIWPSTRRCVGRRSVSVLPMSSPRCVRAKHSLLRRLGGVLSLAVFEMPPDARKNICGQRGAKVVDFAEVSLADLAVARPQGAEKERGKRARNAKSRRRGGWRSPQAEVKNPARLGA